MKITEFTMTDNSGEVIEAKNAAVARFLIEAGLHLAGQAQRELENAPRRIDTGTLRNSITFDDGDDYVDVGTNVEYAIYVHEGTRRMEANRFLRNAFDRNEGQLKEMLNGILTD